MPKSKGPYPPEFRQQMVELVRAGRSPEALAKEFEPSGKSQRDLGIAAELVDEPFAEEGGFREIRERPGIGVEIDERACAEIPFEPVKIGGSFHADGSVAH